MAESVTISFENKAAKHRIRNLPESAAFPPDTTVEDVKKFVAKAARIGDFNQIGLFDRTSQKTLKNRRARLVDGQERIPTELLVKDLGPQMAWRMVFLLEYLGPLAIHTMAVVLRGILYPGAPVMAATQWLTLAMFLVHFGKREAETVWVHRFSANTMPRRNLFKNCAHYWLLGGLLCAWVEYIPGAAASTASATSSTPLAVVAGLALFAFGEAGNAAVHLALAALRSPGGTERAIPHCAGSDLVTCPNYMFEVLAWLGVLVVSRNWAVAVFLVAGAVQMYQWARGKESAYRKEFGAQYTKKRYVMLPGLL